MAIARAEAEAIAQIEAKVGVNNATKYLIALKYLEALQRVANGNATKVFLPFESAGVLGALGAVSDIWSGKQDGALLDRIPDVQQRGNEKSDAPDGEV